MAFTKFQKKINRNVESDTYLLRGLELRAHGGELHHRLLRLHGARRDARLQVLKLLGNRLENKKKNVAQFCFEWSW